MVARSSTYSDRNVPGFPTMRTALEAPQDAAKGRPGYRVRAGGTRDKQPSDARDDTIDRPGPRQVSDRHRLVQWAGRAPAARLPRAIAAAGKAHVRQRQTTAEKRVVRAAGPNRESRRAQRDPTAIAPEPHRSQSSEKAAHPPGPTNTAPRPRRGRHICCPAGPNGGRTSAAVRDRGTRGWLVLPRRAWQSRDDRRRGWRHAAPPCDAVHRWRECVQPLPSPPPPPAPWARLLGRCGGALGQDTGCREGLGPPHALGPPTAPGSRTASGSRTARGAAGPRFAAAVVRLIEAARD